MKTLLLSVCTFCAVTAMAQKPASTSAVMKQIRDEGLNHSQVEVIAHQLTDVSGPRLTNSPNQLRAAHWAADQLKRWGLANATLEPWGEFGKGWESEQFYVAMERPYYQPLLAFPAPWTGGTDGERSAEVILVDSLNGIEKYGEQLRNKIVMVNRKDTFLTSIFKATGMRYDDTDLAKMKGGGPTDNSKLKDRLDARKKTNEQMYALQKLGVIAVINTSDGNRDGSVYQVSTGRYKKDTEVTLPIVTVAREDFLRMQRLIKSGVPVRLGLNIKNRFYNDDPQGYNVVAEIPGTDRKLKSQLVMIGGHLDSWNNATGATDNGAGSIAAMEAVRILKALHLHPRRTIRIALWSGEEEGLLGSHGYVKKHFGDQSTMMLTPDQKKISAYYNLDNGSGKIRGIYLQDNEAVGPIFTKWMKPFADMGVTTIAKGNTGSTDHIPFDAVGIPGFQFIQDPLDYGNHTHHSNLDNYDHLFLDDLKQAAIVMAAFVYNTAMRDEPMPRKSLPAPSPWLFD